MDFDHNAAAAAADGLPFSSKNTYHLLIGQPNHDISTHLILATRVPIKVQVFAWLLFKDHLNSKVTSSTRPSPLTPFAPGVVYG
uniref:Reverse transcriptase zinc-binding domain-containing protein n=1 Tax=Triticum urartu TaxID=4572 RepID=A0A8R7UT99_TRIUA